MFQPSFVEIRLMFFLQSCLQTNKQTDKGEKITSSMEVKKEQKVPYFLLKWRIKLHLMKVSKKSRYLKTVQNVSTWINVLFFTAAKKNKKKTCIGWEVWKL